MIFSFITTKSIYTIVYIVKSANVRLLACYVMVILWVCYGYPMVRTATHYSIRRYCVVAVWSRCGHDVVTMWWCYWTDAPCIRHAPYCDVQDANEMRTVENAKQNETYETDTRDIRDDSDIKKSV